MNSLIENIIKNLNVTLSSKNKAILKQINKYEAIRADVARRENLASVLAGELERGDLTESAEPIREQERRLIKERERTEKLIDDLVKQLKPDKD